MENLMKAIKYESYNWFNSGDLKVIGMLMGMQLQDTAASFVYGIAEIFEN